MDLGALDASGEFITIDATDASYVGLKRIRVVFTGQDYIYQQSLVSDFIINVLPAPVIVFTPKEEKEEFTDVSLSVPIGEDWNYSLPPLSETSGQQYD